MKKIFFTLFITFSMMAVQAQEAEWHTDLNKAMAISNKTNKPLFLLCLYNII